MCSYNETSEDIKAQIIDDCVPNNQEARDDF